MKKLILISVFLMGAALQSQDYHDAYYPFFAFSQNDGLGSAIGGAMVSAGSVIPAFTHNPANLGLQGYRIVNLWQNDSEYHSGTITLPQSHFGGLQFVLPVPVYQGSLVAGADFSLTSEYAFISETADTSRREEGGLYNYRIGLAAEFLKNLYVGADLQFLGGFDKYKEETPDDLFTIDYHYKGYTATIGMVQRLLPMLSWGLCVELPTRLIVAEDFYDSVSTTREYAIVRPAVLHTGFSLFLNYLDLFYEYEYNNWPNLQFNSDLALYDKGPDLDPTINEEIEQKLQKGFTHHLGAAVHPPLLPVHLYGGYQFIRHPEKGVYQGDKLQSYHFGISYVVQQQISLAIQHQKYFWTYAASGVDNDWTQNSLSAILHF